MNDKNHFITRTLFEITCGYCGRIYNHKIYHGNEMVYIGKDRPEGGYRKEISHGICEECKPMAYKANGLEEFLE